MVNQDSMTQEYPQFERATGIYYKNEVKTIKKSGSAFQFLYEAFMNAWEAIVEKFTPEHINLGTININLYRNGNLASQNNGIYDFVKFEVVDNGIGINDTNYNRLLNLRDDSKKMSNKGTGRIQYIHFFDHTYIDSVFKKGNDTLERIQITLSKNDAFLSHNAIIRLDKREECDGCDTGTTVTFETPLVEKDKNNYSTITLDDLRKEFVKHFLSLFCENKAKLPKIQISSFINNEEKEKFLIGSDDIPTPDKDETLEIAYSKLDEKQKIVPSERKEVFNLKAFRLPQNELSSNAIYLVSKGSTGVSIDLNNLRKDDQIDGKRYMFLLSGNYLDDRDRDERGNLELVDSKDFKKQTEGNLFPEEVILKDTIKDETNGKISQLYEELELKNQEKNKNIDELKRMFLLNDKTVEAIRSKIKNTDDDESILKIIYKADSELEAEQDSKIKEQIDELKLLTPDKSEHYQTELKQKVEDFVSVIPLQNRTALSKYVARRKLILELFGQILTAELESVKNGKKQRIDEKLLHNLIFQQSTESSNPEDNDLWLINEDFIYFKGFSEFKLDDVKIGEDYLFKRETEMTEEELEYKHKCNRDAGDRRPDILIFPQEGKCIIIEFKAPDVNVSEHLNQINRYATLINNLSSDNMRITTFYGYLIGENIDTDDVMDADSDFKSAGTLNFLFRSHKYVNGKFGREKGSLYTEVIKYSELLERAKLRNQIFIDKLTKKSE